MKNRNKYTNLGSGLAFWALNNGSIIFTLLSIYGLMMVRDFTIKEEDNKLKSLTEGLMALSAIRGLVGLWSAYSESNILPYLIIFISVVVFILSIVTIKRALQYLTAKLQEYELVNLISKVNESYYIVIVVDAILVLFLLVILFTSIFPVPFLLNFVSVLLNPTFNMMFSLGLTFIKYFASRSFSRSAIMLTNAAQLEEKF